MNQPLGPRATRDDLHRLRVVLHGAVQGVGFRPFVYRLAAALDLPGWVNNSAQGVFIEVEGRRERLEEFRRRLETDKPPHSFIHSLEASWLDPVGYTAFEIRHSDEAGAKTALILPDLATCPDCRREIFDAANRRYRYPFTNCTNCGPRFSIIEALPYDRPHTTMRHFPMCAACRAEYDNPLDRRFHAQPNACPQCGPHLELWDATGNVLAARDAALQQAAQAIRQGQIVAVKGLGGFHLMVDARDEAAVQRLRQRKRREAKPLALMFPNLEQVREQCEVGAAEERLLCSSEAPIVLLRRRKESLTLAGAVAPGNPFLGVMLPYTPLHHLLMAELGFPVVATSGNLSDEPICTDEREALVRLGGIADVFLTHDRPIARHVDDSIVRVLLGREQVLRRARGYAPLPIHLKAPVPPTLAVGAHLKNAVALAVGAQVFVSQHIGDLETEAAYGAFGRVIADFERLYAAPPERVVCDAHPDYLSTRYAVQRAAQRGLPVQSVQHHFAHVLACLAENDVTGPALGVSWDGTGYGPDGTVWGGEFLRVVAAPNNALDYERVAHFRTFRLPGGDTAIRAPRRAAVGVLYELCGEAWMEMTELDAVRSLSAAEAEIVRVMLRRGLNAPRTSSVGRLFDAVAALVGLRQTSRFEGQAAMDLEFALDGLTGDEFYGFRLVGDKEGDPPSPLQVDWRPVVSQLLDDVRRRVAVAEIALKFHNALVEAIIAVARWAGEERVALSGGCFQNRYLSERAVHRLRAEGFRPYWHQRVPPNDGGIALGQIVAASRSQDNRAP